MALKTLDPRRDAGGWGDSDESEAIVSEINITPLVDIFLVLLIIFMVTSSVLSQLGVDVQLPSAATASSGQQNQDAVIITLGASGGWLKLNGEALPGVGALEDALRRAFSKTASRMVVLEGDEKAFLGAAVEVIDQAKKAGATGFAIATQGTGKAAPSKAP